MKKHIESVREEKNKNVKFALQVLQKLNQFIKQNHSNMTFVS